MSSEAPRANNYEIRVAGALGDGLIQAFPGMRVAHLRPSTLLRIQVAQEDWDPAQIVAMLRERGHSVTSLRRCRTPPPANPPADPAPGDSTDQSP